VNPESRDALLTAIAKARVWIEDLVEGRVASFAEIAKQEGKVERHVRFLAPLAFVSPRIISDIAQGVVSPNLTATCLAKRIKFSWSEQEDNRS
jgi:site-specific DNA recombinase